MNEKTKLNQMIKKQNEDFKKLEDEKAEVSQCFYVVRINLLSLILSSLFLT